MAMNKTRGLTNAQELNEEFLYRDTRPMLTKAVGWLRIPANMSLFLVAHAGLAILVPGISDFALISAMLFTLWGMTRREECPIKFPVQSRLMDHNQPHPATGKPTPAAGIFFLGNEMKTGKEIWLTNSDCRQHFLVLGTTGAGKSLPNDALVHTPTGWKRMGDIRLGDLVSTPDGKSAVVDGVYPQGELEICRITFADGRTAEACPEHLWEIHHKHWSGRYKRGVSRAGKAAPRLLRTREIAELLERNKGSFNVRLPEAVEKPAAVLSVDPYLLGALIGDGNLCGSTFRFSTADAAIATRVGESLAPLGFELFRDEYAAECDFRIRQLPDNRRPGSRPASLRQAVRDMGLEGLHSHEKFIPESYKSGSISQRWALVQGLMDTDGTADSRHGAMSYSTTSERLAKDLQEVIWSLGGIAKIRPKQSSYRGSDGGMRQGRPSWVVHIRHPEPTQFFSLPRKAEKVDKPYQYAKNLKLAIIKVETVRRAEATCIHIDHPDHLFITNGYVVTHNTESLLGFAANALTWGSGFLFCDGKGDVALFAKVYALARRFGREDDLLVLNFMTGNQDLGSQGGKILSNTLNPFASGSSDSLTQMVVSLMDEVGGDGAMWKGRATAMFTGVMRALTWLRDQHVVDLNIGEIRDHLNLKRIIDLGDASKFPDMPQQVRKSIKSYLSSLPGFQDDKGYKQSQTTLDQHGYLEMQFTKILGSLADVYGHIFHTPSGEVDMHDVVLNRRILVIMLPALEKSGDEIANLGKIVVATLKGMMGGTLGSQIEGNWAEVVENRPTNSPSPFLCILDEVGYYTVEGMALMAAQARSLGFSMVYASQDIPAMTRLNEKEAKSIIANTNTKIFMRTEEAKDTGGLAVESGGKGSRTRVSSFKGNPGEAGIQYRDTLDTNIEQVDRVNFVDLKAQGEGEMTILFQDKVIRAKSFYANPESSIDRKSLTLRANHFIKVAKPDPEELETARRAPELMERFLSPDFARRMLAEEETARASVPAAAAQGEEIAVVADTFERMTAKRKKPIDSACAAVANLVRIQKGSASAFAANVKTAAGIVDELGGDGSFEDEFERDILTEGRPGGRRGDVGVPVESEIPFGRTAQPDLLDEADLDDDELESDDENFGGEGHKTTDQTGTPDPQAERPKKLSKLRAGIPHGVSIEGGPIVDMAARITSNDSVMRALAALDFDTSTETKDSVDNAIETALSTEAKGIEDAFEAIQREALESADSAVEQVVPTSKPKPEKPAEVPAAEPFSPDEDPSVSAVDFLQSLLGDKNLEERE